MSDFTIDKKERTVKDYMKFIVPSILGIILLMIPFSYKGDTTIVVALLAGLTTSLLENILPYVIVFFMLITSILTIAFKIFPNLFSGNDFIRGIADTSLPWLIVRLVGFILGVMTLFKLGPEMIWSENTGGLILFDLLLSLFTIFFFAGLLLPLLTDFGLLEFVGVLLTPIMRPVFKLPGRSSVNCVTSWVGDGTIGVALTNQQYLQGYYTAREAAVISTTFSAVSITFCLVILQQVGLAHMFGQYYLTILLVGMIAAIVMPRIPPLSRKPDTYYTGESMDVGETIPEGYTTIEWGLHLAVEKAENSGGLGMMINNGFETAFDMWLAVLPVIMAMGTISVIIAEYTTIFQLLGKPFLPILKAFDLPYAVEASETIMIGFADMFLPSVIGASIPSDMTRFVIATLSVSQLVYLSEAGAVILGTDIPVTPLDLFIIFIERTIIVLPIIILVAKILF